MTDIHYFDSAATSRNDPDVMDVICDTMRRLYGNPSSLYRIGRDAAAIVSSAQDTMRDYIHASDKDKIIFTSSGTEANNIALSGIQEHYGHVYSSPIAHKSVTNHPFVRPLTVDQYGFIDLVALEADLGNCYYCENDPILVTVDVANNEIGTVQNIKKISEIAHKYDALLHCDATQSFATLRPDVQRAGIDMLTCSFHKLGTPPGIGMLYVKDGIELSNSIWGGQQMYGLRPGTENVPYIAGANAAVKKLFNKDVAAEISKITVLKKFIQTSLLDIPNSRLNGPVGMRMPNNINISFKDVDGESLVAALDKDGYCVSAGSACNSKNYEPSHVLRAIGVPDEYIYGTIRITLDDKNTFSEADELVKLIKKHVRFLRSLKDSEKE